MRSTTTQRSEGEDTAVWRSTRPWASAAAITAPLVGLAFLLMGVRTVQDLGSVPSDWTSMGRWVGSLTCAPVELLLCAGTIWFGVGLARQVGMASRLGPAPTPEQLEQADALLIGTVRGLGRALAATAVLLALGLVAQVVVFVVVLRHDLAGSP